MRVESLSPTPAPDADGAYTPNQPSDLWVPSETFIYIATNALGGTGIECRAEYMVEAYDTAIDDSEKVANLAMRRSLQRQAEAAVTTLRAKDQPERPMPDFMPDDELDQLDTVQAPARETSTRSKAYEVLINSGKAKKAHIIAAAVSLLGGAATMAGPLTAVSSAQEHVVTNPYHLADGKPAPAPDVDAVVTSTSPYNVELAYTTDHDQKTEHGTAFGLYRTADLRHITPDGYIFPKGHTPWWALPPATGEYWSPVIKHIGNHWESVFSADVNPAKAHLYANGHQVTGKVLGVAWGPDIHHMYEHTRILHYIGEDNNVPGNTKESFGGAIDPSIALDAATNTLYIAYCEQPNQIHLSTLSANGLFMSHHNGLISHPSYGWEGRVEEGPVLITYPFPNVMGLVINTDSTWQGSYKQAFALSLDPAEGHFHKYNHPIIQSGNNLHGPGMGSQPFLGPDGKSWYVFMHVQLQPSHLEMNRYLALEPWHWNSGQTLLLPPSATKSVDTSPSTDQGNNPLNFPVPGIGTGLTNRHILTPFMQKLLAK